MTARDDAARWGGAGGGEAATVEYTNDLDVCFDCLMFIANGGCESVEPSWCPDNKGLRPHDYTCDGTCEAAAQAHVDAVWGRFLSDGWHLAIGARDCEWCGVEATDDDGERVEDCEPWFSWSSCHGCGSRLGGSRHHAVAWRETQE